MVKSSPNKTEEILKKRERIEDDDLLQELEETLHQKKIKPNEEEIKKAFDTKIDSDEELSLKPIRNAAKSRKRIIESDDE